MNILKTSAQAEIEIKMIDTTYIALSGKNMLLQTLSFASWSP